MTSQTLREARKYEEAFEKTIKKEERPEFHLTPRTGWMNDPNGFPGIRVSIICSINIIHMNPSGDRCTGDMR